MILGQLGQTVRTLPRVPRTSSARILAVAAVLACLTAIPVLLAGGLQPAAQPSTTVPWWLLAGALAVVELKAIDFHHRGHTHAFTSSEVPLVLALFFLPAREVVLAVAAGRAAGIALLLVTILVQDPVAALLLPLAALAEIHLRLGGEARGDLRPATAEGILGG